MSKGTPAIEPNQNGDATNPSVLGDESMAEPALSPEIAARIGESLRLYYDRMMREPVPDHLIRLVDRLNDKVSAPDAD